MSRSRVHLARGLTKSHKRPAGAERGATAERGKMRVAVLPTGVKVVDRDTVLEVLSQLRDLVESYAEEVNDRAVVTPPKPRSRRLTAEEQDAMEEEWLSADVPEEE